MVLPHLSDWGFACRWARPSPFVGIRFVGLDSSADAVFPDEAARSCSAPNFSASIIAERAEQLGTDFLWGTSVSGICAEGVRIGDRVVRCRWIVGADGSNSLVRRWAGLDDGRKPRLRYAYRRHYRVAPWTDHMEIHWGARAKGMPRPLGEIRCAWPWHPTVRL